MLAIALETLRHLDANAPLLLFFVFVLEQKLVVVQHGLGLVFEHRTAHVRLGLEERSHLGVEGTQPLKGVFFIDSPWGFLSRPRFRSKDRLDVAGREM